jgi:hypothetical protein
MISSTGPALTKARRLCDRLKYAPVQRTTFGMCERRSGVPPEGTGELEQAEVDAGVVFVRVRSR